MIEHWLIATLLGALSGFVLYTCVRLRMHMGPLFRARFGNRARQAVWAVTILIMIIFMNLALAGLRIYLHRMQEMHSTLLLEAWFAVLSLIVAMSLVFRRMNRNTVNKSSEKHCS